MYLFYKILKGKRKPVYLSLKSCGLLISKVSLVFRVCKTNKGFLLNTAAKTEIPQNSQCFAYI